MLTLLSIIILVVAVSSGIITPIYAISEGNFLTYDNPSLGIKIQYPSSWLKTDVVTNMNFTRVIFYLKEKITNETIATIGIQSRSEPLQITTIEDLRNNFILGLSNDKSPINLINSSETTLSDHPAFKVFHDDPPIPVIIEGIPAIPAERVMEIWIFNPTTHKSYSIDYSAQPAFFSQYFPLAQKMINSFKVNW
jgi:hypothetical protein